MFRLLILFLWVGLFHSCKTDKNQSSRNEYSQMVDLVIMNVLPNPVFRVPYLDCNEQALCNYISENKDLEFSNRGNLSIELELANFRVSNLKGQFSRTNYLIFVPYSENKYPLFNLDSLLNHEVANKFLVSEPKTFSDTVILDSLLSAQSFNLYDSELYMPKDAYTESFFISIAKTNKGQTKAVIATNLMSVYSIGALCLFEKHNGIWYLVYVVYDL